MWGGAASHFPGMGMSEVQVAPGPLSASARATLIQRLPVTPMTAHLLAAG